MRFNMRQNYWQTMFLEKFCLHFWRLRCSPCRMWQVRLYQTESLPSDCTACTAQILVWLQRFHAWSWWLSKYWSNRRSKLLRISILPKLSEDFSAQRMRTCCQASVLIDWPDDLALRPPKLTCPDKYSCVACALFERDSFSFLASYAYDRNPGIESSSTPYRESWYTNTWPTYSTSTKVVFTLQNSSLLSIWPIFFPSLHLGNSEVPPKKEKQTCLVEGVAAKRRATSWICSRQQRWSWSIILFLFTSFN